MKLRADAVIGIQYDEQGKPEAIGKVYGIGGEFKNQIIEPLKTEKEIDAWISKVTSTYDISLASFLHNQKKDVLKKLSDKILELYLEDGNEARYVFRTVCDRIEKERGIGSNQMVNADRISVFLDRERVRDIIASLVTQGYLRVYTSKRSETYKGHKTSGSTFIHWVGATGEGWKVYNIDKAKRNY